MVLPVPTSPIITLIEHLESTPRISEFNKSNMQNPQTYYQLALTYMGDGNTEEAKKYADQCANFNALINLNQAFVRNKAQELLSTL